MKKNALLGVVAAAVLVGCSNDELVNANQASLNEISFETFVNKTTRATDIDNINIGTFANGFSVYGFTKGAETDATWSPLFKDEHVYGSGIGDQGSWSYDNIQYWKENNSYHFHAIAPYGDATATTDVAAKKRHWENVVDATDKAKTTISFTNIAKSGDTYTAEGEQDLVYGYNNATGLASGNNKVGFTFTHLLSRVKFRIIGDDSNPVSVTISVTDVTLKNTYSKGDITITNTDASDKESLADTEWTLSADDKTDLSFGEGLNDISTKTGQTNEAETNHKYIIPEISQKVSYQAVFSFELEANVNGEDPQTYTATKTVDLPEVQMLKGNSYVYEIRVNVSGNSSDNNLIEPIVFNVVEVEEWDDWSTPTYGNITNPEDVQPYDYAMKDGSFVHLEDGEELTDVQKQACLGLVFWTKNKSTTNLAIDDPALLNSSYKDCTHGLIVSCDYLSYNGKTSMQWLGGTTEDYQFSVYEEFQKDNEALSGYESILGGTKDDSYANANRMLGYNNTQVLKLYNESDLGKQYPFVPVLALDNLSDIPGTSGWYIPSVKELVVLFSGENIAQNTFTNWDSLGGDNTETIEKLLSNIVGTSVKIQNRNIASNTEAESSYGYYFWCLDASEGIPFYGDYSVYEKVEFFPICAF